jgi:hypothetical protein
MSHPRDAEDARKGRLAFMDESESDRRADPGTYILAAALIEPDALEKTQTQIRTLLVPGQRKLHWRDESARRRLAIAETIAMLDSVHLVVARTGGSPRETSERRRRKCLERMVCELDQRGVDHIVAESRESTQNMNDMTVFNALRSSRTVSARLRLVHQPGPVEPALWIADAIAGAVVAARTGDGRYLDTVKHLVDVVKLPAEG